MKQHKKLWYTLILHVILCITVGLYIPQKVLAASATIGFEVEQNPVTTGDMVTISLTIDTDTLLGDFEGNIEYNSEVLEYASGPSCIAGGGGMLRVSDFGASSSWTTRSYVMTFEAIGIGECVFKVAGTPAAYAYEDQMAMSISSSSKTVTVLAPATASTNNELEIMKINPGTLTPTFDSAISEYSTIVDNQTKRLIISAIPKDIKSNIQITGNQDFVVGSNYVTVTVIAESGDKKEYTIHVVKEETTRDDDFKEAKEENVYFHASKSNDVITLQGLSTYTVISGDASVMIPQEYTKSSIQIDGVTIPVYQLKNNIEDDYLLMILQSEYGQTGLYRYDRVEKTIQRYNKDRVIIQESSNSDKLELIAVKKQYENQINKLNLYVILLAVLSVLLLVGIISLFIKNKSHQEDDF